MTTPTTSASQHHETAHAAATHGAALTFETVGTFDGASAPVRISPDQWTLLRVIDGVVRLTTGNVERLLHPGEEAIVAAGRPHRIAAAVGQARLVTGFRATPLP